MLSETDFHRAQWEHYQANAREQGDKLVRDIEILALQVALVHHRKARRNTRHIVKRLVSLRAQELRQEAA